MNVLLTGGTGTFGYALCREIQRGSLDFKLTILARSELSLAKMRLRFPEHRYVVGDVRDLSSMMSLIPGHEGIIHAAAMKRIPECERQPDECYKTNVLGSYNVLLAARASGVDWCLGISTDKACGAVTTYGASKLMMEGLFLGEQISRYGTKFLLVRYGNIISSNGSVLPLWESQNSLGKRLTITNTEMTRFWMSPSEAIRLVLRRVEMRDYQGILVPKMKSMSIVDMAQALFPDTGFEVVGLRSTEKLHEDLVLPNEMCDDMGLFHYMVRGARGDPGLSYSSRSASKLIAPELKIILQDALDLEEIMR